MRSIGLLQVTAAVAERAVPIGQHGSYRVLCDRFQNNFHPKLRNKPRLSNFFSQNKCLTYENFGLERCR